MPLNRILKTVLKKISEYKDHPNSINFKEFVEKDCSIAWVDVENLPELPLFIDALIYVSSKFGDPKEARSKFCEMINYAFRDKEDDLIKGVSLLFDVMDEVKPPSIVDVLSAEINLKSGKVSNFVKNHDENNGFHSELLNLLNELVSSNLCSTDIHPLYAGEAIAHILSEESGKAKGSRDRLKAFVSDFGRDVPPVVADLAGRSQPKLDFKLLCEQNAEQARQCEGLLEWPLVKGIFERAIEEAHKATKVVEFVHGAPVNMELIWDFYFKKYTDAAFSLLYPGMNYDSLPEVTRLEAALNLTGKALVKKIAETEGGGFDCLLAAAPEEALLLLLAVPDAVTNGNKDLAVKKIYLNAQFEAARKSPIFVFQLCRALKLAWHKEKPQKKTVSLGARDADVVKSAIFLLLELRYRHQAINHLILGDLHLLDPVIGDAACELRPPFLLEAHAVVQAYLGDDLEKVKGLVSYYNKWHAKEEMDETKIGSVLEICSSAKFDARYDLYLIWVKKLGHALAKHFKFVDDYVIDKNSKFDPMDFLTECKLHTRATYIVRDCFGVEGEDGMRDFIGAKEKKRRRDKLARYTVEYTRALAARQEEQKPRPKNIDGLREVVQTCQAVKGSSMPLLPIFEAQKLGLLSAFQKGLPLILRLSRIKVIPHEEGERLQWHIEKRAETEEKKEDVGLVSEKVDFVSEKVPNKIYELQGTRVFLYRPDHKTGRFVLVDEEDPQYKKMVDCPGYAISAYSLYDPGEVSGEWFAEPEASDYFAGVAKLDIIHLLYLSSVNHPPFAEGSGVMESKKFTTFAGEEDFNYLHTLYPPKQEIKKHLAEGGVLEWTTPYSFYKDWSLAEEVGHYFRTAKKYKFNNCRYQEGKFYVPGDEELKRVEGQSWRLATSVPFYSVHLYASSLAIELSRVTFINANATKADRFMDAEKISAEFDKIAHDELMAALKK